MKFCFLTSYYPPFLTNFFKENPSAVNLSYSELKEKLLNQFFADTGALYHNIKEFGNEVFLIISNCDVLQKKWAKENNISFDENNWEKQIAIEQIKLFKPDIFYLESVFEFYGDFVKEIRPYCKHIISWISTPFSSSLKLNDLDLILSSTPDFVSSFKNQGIKSEYMLPAFDARVVDQLKSNTKKDIPFSFVGGWSDVHINRKEALISLVKHTNIQLWGYGYKKYYSRKTLAFYQNYFKENKSILKVYNGEVWGLKMYDILHRSVLTFNIHEGLLNGNVGNMRMFEATGVGTLLLNDNGKNINSLFEVGKEIETYHSIPEAIEKVKYYNANPEKAIEMGRNAQNRTLKDYNYKNYTQILMSYINKHF